jgi:ABC-type multidrug transport system ATPase subunit
VDEGRHHEAGISKVTKLVESSGSKIRSLSKREPSLEDVFVALVGRGLGENGA